VQDAQCDDAISRTPVPRTPLGVVSRALLTELMPVASTACIGPESSVQDAQCDDAISRTPVPRTPVGVVPRARLTELMPVANTASSCIGTESSVQDAQCDDVEFNIKTLRNINISIVY